MTVEFAGAARRINARDIEHAAQSIGCEVAALRAVMAVESRNSGFDAKRRPIILFEPHVFHRNLPQGSAKQIGAEKQGLAYRRWGERPYPKTSDGNYDRLSRAIKIDQEAAFRAVSMGMGQILGENFRVAGHASATEMFEAAKESEADQLAQMIGFIRGERIDDHLREKNWPNFARAYNGNGQVEKYAKALSTQYAKWKKIAATPREEISAGDLRDAGSRTIAATDQIKNSAQAITAAGASASAVLSQAGDVVQQAKDLSEGVKAGAPYIELVHAYWPIIALSLLTGAAFFFAWRIWSWAHKAESARVDDARTGLHGGL